MAHFCVGNPCFICHPCERAEPNEDMMASINKRDIISDIASEVASSITEHNRGEYFAYVNNLIITLQNQISRLKERVESLEAVEKLHASELEKMAKRVGRSHVHWTDMPR